VPYVKNRGGTCPLCMKKVSTLEEHEECYDPKRVIWICHKCHFYRHHFHERLSKAAWVLLEKIRGDNCKEYKPGFI